MVKTAVTTRSFNNYRDGANTNESVLTSIHVQQKGISHLFDINLEDGQRGTEGMPLLVPDLVMRDGLKHDVLYTADMSGNAYAFDANTGQKLWKQHIGNPIIGNRKIDMYLLNDYWSMLASPVINLATKTLYVVAMKSPDGLINDSSFWLHALNLVDGSDQAPPLNLNNASYQAPGLKATKLGSVPRKQRCGLLFDSRNGVDTVFVMCGSFAESASTNQGWCIACDVTNLKLSIAAAWTTTARYSGGGLWMGGQGPSMDDAGFIYAMVGNGAFDGITDFCESFIKLQYTPKTATSAASLKIVDWWTPFNDTGRVYGIPGQSYADDSVVPASVKQGFSDDGEDSEATSNMDSAGDEDLNSGGPLLLPKSLTGFSKDAIVGAGKDGIAYIVDMNNMGKTSLKDFSSAAGVAKNFSKLLFPPYGFTYYPAGIDLMTPDFSIIPTTYGGYTHHQHSTPVCYQSPDHGFMIFTCGENGPVRAFTLKPDFSLNYVACGDIIASGGMKPPGGMPGGMMTLSCDGQGTNTGVLWVTFPTGNANKTITEGRLVAYGANWDDHGSLIKIWDSFDWGINFKFNKFNIPACINGKVYVPTYDSRIMVFG